MASLSCPQDASFGPVSSCRMFDFTLTFEATILSLLPSCIFILFAAAVVAQLRTMPRLVQPLRYLPRLGKCLIGAKMLAVAVATVADLASTILWSSGIASDVPGSGLSTSALAIRAVASAASLPVLWLEFFRSLHGSPLMPLYLTVVILCDAARLRTFALLGFDPNGSHGSIYIAFFALFSVGYVCRFFAWWLELASKDQFLERAEGDRATAPEETASFFARLFITSIDPIMIRGFRTDLTIQSLGSIHSQYDAGVLYEHGQPIWELYAGSGKTHPLFRTLFKAFGGTLLSPIIPCVVYSCATITQPTLITQVLRFVESYTTPGAIRIPAAHGWGLVGAYGLVFTISTLSWSLFQMSALRSSVVMRGFLVQMIYRKALRIEAEAAKAIGAASSTSLMSVDVERMMLQMEAIHLVYSSLIIVMIGLVILYYTVGIAFVATIICAFAFFASLPFLTRNIPSYQKAWSSRSDQRVKLINSIIRNVKAVKLSGYEDILTSKVHAIRELEVVRMMTYAWSLILVAALTNWLKGILSLATLITYTVISLHSDTASVSTVTFFTTIAVLGVITDPLLIVGQRYAAIMAASASLERIEEFLKIPERKETRQLSATIRATDLCLGTQNGAILKNLNFELPNSRLTMVIGKVGSGKSSLLHGMMGELEVLSGQLEFPTNASVGFCAQDAWLRPGDTIRQNIQFVSPSRPALYRAVIKACCLDVDIRIWPQADRQKAQGLSGGQRARIALARALYAQPDILILDDIFSALDKQIEEHIFTALFGQNGLLTGRTVILATNAVHRLRSADKIVLLSDASIGQQGTFRELAASAGAVKDLIEVVGTHQDDSQTYSRFIGRPDDTASSFVGSLAVSVDEIEAEMADKVATQGAFRTFCRAGGSWSFIFTSVIMLLMSAMPGIIPLYIQAWTSAVQSDQSRMLTYLGGYVAIEVAYILMFCLALGFWYAIYSKSMCKRLHRRQITQILRTPLAYFDDKPIGRILSQFSQDVFVLDFQVGNAWNNFFGLATAMVVDAVVLTVAAPYVGIVILATFVLCFFVQRFYVRTSRQVRRMDFIAKSPLYTLFAETMDANGLKTIRAVRAQEELSKIAVNKGNTSQVPYFLTEALKKWLALVLGSVVTIINCMLVVVAVANRQNTSSGLLAVALVQATSLVMTLNYMILSGAEFETALVSVARIQEVIELPSESDPAGRSPDKVDNVEHEEKSTTQAPPSQWVTAGSVRFENVCLRYRPELPLALSKLSFSAPARQRLGIVGRSGCGKSTCLAALFRMMETESGSIYIDGIDIRSMPRARLRQAMTIIPQDPLLLEMTIRDNLDVEGVKTDQEIWAALEQTQIKTLIESQPDKLDTLVTSDGGDFSRGERQLLALARGLLRQKRILVLDEASSSLDIATDTKVQQVIRNAFQDCTIITVAHRIDTLLDYDQVLVLGEGSLLESGRPTELLQDSDSAFSKLYNGQTSGGSPDDVQATPDIMNFL